MPDVNVKIEDDQLKAAIEAAIFNALTGEARDKMVKEVIASMTKTSGPYERDSMLHRAMKEAASDYARKAMAEWFEKDLELKLHIEKVYKDAIQLAFGMDLVEGGNGRDKMIRQMADGIIRALSNEGRY